MQSEHESGTKGLRENFLYRLKAAFGRVRGLAAGPPYVPRKMKSAPLLT